MSELRESIEGILHWWEANHGEADFREVTGRIVDLLPGPVMPATPSGAVVDELSWDMSRDRAIATYGDIRDALAKEQGR